MKIRQKTLLNNLLTGLLPLLTVAFLLLILHRREEFTIMRKNMESYVNTFKIALEADLEKFRNYTYFISHQNFLIEEVKGRIQFRLSDESMFGTRYKVRMYEVFLGNTNYYRDIYNWRDVTFAASQPAIDYIWEHLQSPQYTRRYTTTIPDLVSNVLVLRNCSIIYDLERNAKTGFAEIVTPLDYDYFSEFAFQEFELVYFIQTPNGFVLSNPDLNKPSVIQKLQSVQLKDSGSLPKIKLDDGKTYYFYRSPLMQISPLDLRLGYQEKKWTYIGVLYDVNMKNKQFFQFQNMSRISILLSIIILSLISLWFSNTLTRPLSKLEYDIARFDKEMSPITPPPQIKDEITSIQNSFASMSQHILENTRIIKEERNKLQLQQELMDNELDLARKIQMNLIPKSSPVDYIRFFYQPMEKLGGDFLKLTPLSFDRMGIFISDVSGHGVPAALVTTMLNSFIVQNLDDDTTPSGFMYDLNEFILRQSTENFVTALFGIYDPVKKNLTYSVAGHNLPYIIHKDQVYCQNTGSRGLPLGILNTRELKYMEKGYMDITLEVPAGDHILFTTDGVEEAVNRQTHIQNPDSLMEDFGEAVMIRTIHEHFKKRKKDLIRSITAGLQEFRGTDSFDDDICIIDLEVK